MSTAALSTPRPAARLPLGSIVLTPDLVFSLEQSARKDLAKFGAYHASQDTRFRDFSTGGFPNNSRPESDYLPRYDRAKIIARSRVAFRNNPYLNATVTAYVMEIGTPTMKSQTSAALYNDAKERRFERWATDCEAEQDLSLAQVIEIYNYEDAVGGGELFILKRIEGWLQLIASELCGSAQTKKTPIAPGSKFADGTPIPAGSTELDGIVRDSAKLIIGYRFGTRDDMGSISFAPERSAIVRREYVWHLFDPARAEQGRGVPRCAAVMNQFQDLFETAGARAQQVKNAACLSMWITKNIDPSGFAETMRGALNRGQVQEAAELKTIAESRSAYQEVKAGAVYYGATGEDLKVIEPKLNAADFHDHYIDLLQVCCACFQGLPVEIAIEGFRASNYSSSRATVNKWKRNVARWRRFIEHKFLDPLQLWQSNRWHLLGDLAPAPASPPESATHNTDENVFWGWPAIPDIDGLKTAEQNIKEYEAGMTTLEEIYAAKGQHADVQLKRFGTEKTALAKMMRQAAIDAGLPVATADSVAASYLSASTGLTAIPSAPSDAQPPA